MTEHPAIMIAPDHEGLTLYVEGTEKARPATVFSIAPTIDGWHAEIDLGGPIITQHYATGASAKRAFLALIAGALGLGGQSAA